MILVLAFFGADIEIYNSPFEPQNFLWIICLQTFGGFVIYVEEFGMVYCCFLWSSLFNAICLEFLVKIWVDAIDLKGSVVKIFLAK